MISEKQKRCRILRERNKEKKIKISFFSIFIILSMIMIPKIVVSLKLSTQKYVKVEQKEK